MNNQSPTTKRLHQLAEKEREKDNLPKALNLATKAINKYVKQKNFEGLCEALQGRFLTYKHFFLLKNNPVFAKIAKKDAIKSLQVAQKHHLLKMIASCSFRLGEAAMLFENFEEAAKNYKTAINYCHQSSATRGDYRYHLGETLFRKGQKAKGKETMLIGLAEIKNNATKSNSFPLHVWESGCYMRLAELLKEDPPAEAREYLAQAKKIVDSDKRLVIRERQLRKLVQNFS